jgi:hypothetical protein
MPVARNGNSGVFTVYRFGVLALVAVSSFAAPVMADSLCSDDRATKAVKKIVQDAIPEWAVDLATQFGDWAKIERVKNVTKVVNVASIRAVSRDKDTMLTTCVAKVTFALDDHTMAPEIRYTVQPLEDKPDTLHVEIFAPRHEIEFGPKPSTPAPVTTAPASPAPPINTTVVVNNLPPAALEHVIVAPSPLLDYDAFSCFDLTIARNEAYARHGYVFRRPELTEYFSKQPWYHPLITNQSAISLSASEERIVNAVRSVELKKRCERAQ